MATSEIITNWGAALAVLFAGITVWRDLRRQTIAGSLPTEFTQSLVDHVKGQDEKIEKLEARLDAKDKEQVEYARKSRNWFYAATAAASKGEPLPAPPPDWP